VLHQLAPRSKVALLMNPNNPSAAMEQHDPRRRRRFSVKSLVLNVASKDDFPAAFETFIREGRMRFLSPRTDAAESARGDRGVCGKATCAAIHFERQYRLSAI